MLNRRQMLGATMALSALSPRISQASTEVGDNGLHQPAWLHQGFLNLRDDLTEARAAGKGLIVLWEQRACPYCRELHRVNFADKRIVDYMTKHFMVVQLDLWGARPVTGFDGIATPEKNLAQGWNVNFTPTLNFFSASAEGRSENFRMPGYFKKFHFISALEYVATGEYASQPFQRYLQAKFTLLESKGVKPDMW